jgi:aminoglycoside phosphotransferase (APT) family kinase protein
MDEKTRKLSGVIDWGDVHLGDPAIDISIALTFLPREGRQIFAEAYGDISTPQWNLAFFRALVHNFTILEYSETISDVALLRESRIALYNILDNYQDLALGKNYSPRELLVP